MDMKTLGKQVASFLGDDWQISTLGNDTVRLIRIGTVPNPAYGVRLVNTDPNAAKFVIWGSWPKATDDRAFPNDSEKTSPIYVMKTQTPKKIADAIRTKFLPDYNTAFLKAAAECSEHDKYLVKRRELTSRFAKILKGEVNESGDRIHGGPSSATSIRDIGTVRDFYVNATDSTVSFALMGVPVDIVEQMLNIWLAHWETKCRSCGRPLDDNDLCTYRECPRYGTRGL